MRLRTSQLDAGAAYTFWWVIFNNPGSCTAPCNVDDVDPSNANGVGSSVLYAAGHVVGTSGKTSAASNLRLGDTSGALFGPGLLEPFDGEVHLIVRSHGQPIPGMVNEQISSVGGGCGINTCEDQQAAAHLP